ncbi:MAG: 50S ribosomal protein L7ae-like protein [Syntrophomonadaceae bacterium]|nr:50S ribosomal protein L7ae-like protein [Syntrophomonadaceae bacterium]
MSLEDLKGARKVMGTKQVSKAVAKGMARKVYIAGDADQRVTVPLLKLCESRGVEVEMVDSMRKLGRACGIEVGSASAALLND